MMKKLIVLLLMVVMITGCSKEETNQEQPLPTTTPVVETTAPSVTPEPTSISEETTDSTDNEESTEGFKTVNIAGLFDIKVKDPLPEQMKFVINTSDNGASGSFKVHVYSSNPECTDLTKCLAEFENYAYQWYTEEEFENTLFDVPLTENQFVREIETEEGKVLVYTCPRISWEREIENPEERPSYLNEDGTIDYEPEELIRFD